MGRVLRITSVLHALGFMRRALPKTALLLLLALLGGTAQAQVAFDASSGGKNPAAATSFTWSHTVGNGSNLVMVVEVSLVNNFYVTGVTWSGTNPTFSCLFAISVGDASSTCGSAGSGNFRRVEIWGATLGTPATKSGTVMVNVNASTAPVLGSVSFSGATGFGTAQFSAPTGGSAGGPASVTFSGLSGNGAVVDCLANNITSAQGTGQTLNWFTQNAAGAPTVVYGGSSFKLGAVTTMQWTWIGGSTQHIAYVAVPINPSAVVPAKRKAQTIVGTLLPPGEGQPRVGSPGAVEEWEVREKEVYPRAGLTARE